MKAAVFSYNEFERGTSNGWHDNGDNHVLLIQNDNGELMGVNQFDVSRSSTTAEAAGKVDDLWQQFDAAAADLDHVVIYVGSFGAERAIERAADQGIDPAKTTFVFCDCNARKKYETVRRFGFEKAHVVEADCGGIAEMSAIYRSLLANGAIAA